jgi:hypothetical protein
MLWLAAIMLAFVLAGCSLEGRKVDGCTLHEQTSLMSNITWADCTVAAGHVLIPGQGEGYATPISHVAGAAAIASGLGFGLTNIPTTKVP